MEPKSKDNFLPFDFPILKSKFDSSGEQRKKIKKTTQYKKQIWNQNLIYILVKNLESSLFLVFYVWKGLLSFVYIDFFVSKEKYI